MARATPMTRPMRRADLQYARVVDRLPKYTEIAQIAAMTTMTMAGRIIAIGDAQTQVFATEHSVDSRPGELLLLSDVYKSTTRFAPFVAKGDPYEALPASA